MQRQQYRLLVMALLAHVYILVKGNIELEIVQCVSVFGFACQPVLKILF
jgi:hypothetical protein